MTEPTINLRFGPNGDEIPEADWKEQVHQMTHLLWGRLHGLQPGATEMEIEMSSHQLFVLAMTEGVLSAILHRAARKKLLSLVGPKDTDKFFDVAQAHGRVLARGMFQLENVEEDPE